MTEQQIVKEQKFGQNTICVKTLIVKEIEFVQNTKFNQNFFEKQNLFKSSL